MHILTTVVVAFLASLTPEQKVRVLTAPSFIAGQLTDSYGKVGCLVGTASDCTTRWAADPRAGRRAGNSKLTFPIGQELRQLMSFVREGLTAEQNRSWLGVAEEFDRLMDLHGKNTVRDAIREFLMGEPVPEQGFRQQLQEPLLIEA